MKIKISFLTFFIVSFSFISNGQQTLFCEDFSNGFDGNNGTGAWEHYDNGQSDIWMMATSNSPAGQFSEGTPPLNSPTADNGWVILDCDLYNNDLGNLLDITAYLESPGIDCSQANSVIVEFYQYFRYCCQTAPPFAVEVSLNSGLSWTSFPAYGDFSEGSNVMSDNAMQTKVDVSCIAAGQSNVKLRWAYNTGNLSGYTHYYWGIDDICVSTGADYYDLSLTELANGDIINEYAYQITPMAQALSLTDGGMKAYVSILNSGSLNVTGGKLYIEILDELQEEIIYSLDALPFQLAGAPESINCPDPSVINVLINTEWVPENEGTYYLRAYVIHEGADVTPQNNIRTQKLIYSTSILSQVDPDELDVYLEPDPGPNEPHIFGWGSLFSPANPGTLAYGLKVHFGQGSTDNAPFKIGLFQVNSNLEDYDIIAYEEYNYQSAMESTEQILYFMDPAEINPGTAYFYAIFQDEFYYDDIVVLAQGIPDNDFSTVDYLLGNDGDYHWFYGRPFIPAIGLLVTEDGQENLPGCMDPNAINYIAEATTSDGSCIYQIPDGCADPDALNYLPFSNGQTECIFECDFPAITFEPFCESSLAEEFSVLVEIPNNGSLDSFVVEELLNSFSSQNAIAPQNLTFGVIPEGENMAFKITSTVAGECIFLSQVYEFDCIEQSIPETEEISFLVFPNPADNVVQVRSDKPHGKAQYELISLSGQLIELKQTYDSVAVFDVSGLSAGIYILKYTDDDRNYSTRIVVE